VASSLFRFEGDSHGLSHPFQKAKLLRDVHKRIVSLKSEDSEGDVEKIQFYRRRTEYLFSVPAYSTGDFFFKKNPFLELGNSLRIQKDIDKMENQN